MPLRSGLFAGLTALALLVAPTAAAEPVEPPAPPTAVQATGALVVTGEARVGSTLLVTGPGWSPADAETTYQWLRGGEPIADLDATDETYTATADDVGAALAVRATGTKEGLTPGGATSEPTAAVALGGLSAVQPPRIDGTARVSSTLSVTAPVWSEAGVATSYQWLRSGVPTTVRSRTYTLKAIDAGRSLSVRATGAKAGYASETADSTATAKVAKIPATVTVRGSSTRVGALRLSVTVAAPGDPAPSGSVSLKQGSKVLTSRLKLARGSASYSATGIKPGRYTYTVRYAGSSRIAADTGSVAVRIKAKTAASISLKPTTSVGKVRIGITVTAAGQPPLGGTAYVKEGSKTLKTTIKVVRGKATFSASAKPGRHTYLVGYRGTSQVRSGTRSVTVRVPAPAKLVAYPNCTALNKVHPHGVGRSNAKDKTSGAPPVTTFLRNTKLYELNTARDRDKDGVACEKR